MRTLETTIHLVEENRNTRRRFTDAQYLSLHTAMESLSGRQFTAIVMRFWCSMAIEDIARTMRISWGAADELLLEALQRLSTNCKCLNVAQNSALRALTGRGTNAE